MKTKSKNNSVSYFDMQFITSSISTTLVLLLLGLVVFFVLTAHNLSVYVKENINFSIIISDDMKETDILKLQKRLDKEVFVRSTEYISKKQALREQVEAMGTDPQDFLGYNPLHASIEVKLHSDYANTDSIAKIEKEIKKKCAGADFSGDSTPARFTHQVVFEYNLMYNKRKTQNEEV